MNTNRLDSILILTVLSYSGTYNNWKRLIHSEIGAMDYDERNIRP
jgi:hypothetical protein